MRSANPSKKLAQARAIPGPGPWMVVTFTWAIWLIVHAAVFGAPPQSPATATQSGVWDASRKPLEGWGSAAAATVAAPATTAVKAEPAKAAPAKAASGSAAPPAAKADAKKTRLNARADTPVPVKAVAKAPAGAAAAPVERLEWPSTDESFGYAPAPPDVPTGTPEPAAEVTAERVRAVGAPPPPTAATAALAKPAEPPPAPAQAKAVITEKKPTPTGLERLSDDWPAWLKVAFQYRGRTESSRGLLAKPDYDTYYLNRLRLNATVVAAPWLQAVFQVQDSQALRYNVSPAPKNMLNTLDLRLGYVAIGRANGPVSARIGRQDLTFGEGRLIGTPDWGNTNRTYDIVRVSAVQPGVKLDVFAGAPIDIMPSRFDPRKVGEDFYGFYASFDKLIPGVVEPFGVVRTNHTATSELGTVGNAVLYTMGGRVAGRIVAGVDYAADVVVQRGDIAGDPVTAWAAHAAFVRTMSHTPWKPKVVLEYNFASGDENAKDGKRQTFDQLYASNHARYGQADLVGWRNIHHFGMNVEMYPAKPLKVTTGVSRFFLASLGDGLYNASGSRTVFLKTATSKDIGWEADVAMTYAVSKELSLGAGLGALFAGPYLKQAGASDTFYAPYVLWTTKF